MKNKDVRLKDFFKDVGANVLVKYIKNMKLVFGICLFLSLITLSFVPKTAFCIGFGEIKLHSFLNEPLRAEIELLDAEPFDPERLMVTLASANEFKRAGLERPFFLSQLRFEVVRQASHTRIRILTKDPIKQPYLDFLIDLSWPGGRMVRGYTLLLDPAPLNGTAGLQDRRSKNDGFSEEGKMLALSPGLVQGNGLSANHTHQAFETLFDPEDKSYQNEIPLPPMTVVSSSLANDSNKISPPVPISIKLMSNEKLPAGASVQSSQSQSGSHSNPQLHQGSQITSGADNPLGTFGTPAANTNVNSESSNPIPSSSMIHMNGAQPISDTLPKTEARASSSISDLSSITHPVAASSVTQNAPYAFQINFNSKQIIIGLGSLLFLTICILLPLFLFRHKRLRKQLQANFAVGLAPQVAVTPLVAARGLAPDPQGKMASASSIAVATEFVPDSSPESQTSKVFRPLANEIVIKLELAHRYLEMGDSLNALPLLNDVLMEGTDLEREMAQKMMCGLEFEKEDT